MPKHPRVDQGGARRLIVSGGEPAPTIMAGGVGSVNTSQYTLSGSESVPDNQPDKPPYRVPSMDEIRALPANGYKVASTFSGCGGSCLGYRMAGFKVLWASEFIEAARDTYRANFPDTIVDARDIRDVQPDDILTAAGVEFGELDLLDGSPPCASFSTAGKRQEGWGKIKQYSDTAQRTDDLFFEFVRILDGVQPKTFVAENVSGLVKGAAKGYFLEILAALKACGYRVAVRVLDAQWLGVPQARQRAIFVGVREDLTDAEGQPVMPCHPEPLPYRYSVREAIPWLNASVTKTDRPSPTVTVGSEVMLVPQFSTLVRDATTEEHMHGEIRKRSTDEPATTIRAKKAGGVKVVQEFPYGSKAEVPLDGPSPIVRTGSKTRGRTDQFIVEEEASMEGLATGAEFDRMGGPGQSDKYFQLIRPDASKPCPTVTVEGGNANAASVCHPTERRKFSIAELRRICAFPDDFILTGSYSQQWERLGRAVPPVMMCAVAEVVRDQILARIVE